MKKVQVTLIRDIKTVWYRFNENEVGAGLPDGLESFAKWATKNLDGTRAVMVKGENGDKMPYLVAADFCRDDGYEVVPVGFKI